MVQTEEEQALPQFALKLDDDFPCGAAYRAIRSPRTNSSSDVRRLQHSDSASSVDSNAPASHQLGFAEPRDNNQSVAATQSAALPTDQDLAKRAQRRVIDHKRSELEKKHELEKMRAKKLESDKLQKERSNQLKLRRRAEIYALNAIMKQVQQGKISKFLEAAAAAQQQQQQQRQNSKTTNSTQVAMNGSPETAVDFSAHVIQSIGV